ncbi:hypothetical protein [Bacillus sp. UNC322MFChir4.1]|uniref:hypothetical protein n=1 Tax=Bacillus sp. UNC322MFChir4.1 TaxID=1449045 RepID=UPI0005571C2A|nr:hypothetical protein [Bacillus sp. UNC322MFChir4.1]
MNSVWKQVAISWRTFEKDICSDVSIEELTDKLMNEIQEGGLLTNTYEYLDLEEDDEDDDWP